MPARKICDILSTAGEFGSLADASRRVAQLQRVYLEAIPPALSKSSRIAWARGGVLTVIADNGAIAAKLRQTTSRILNHLRQSGFEFNSMRIEVQVGQSAGYSPYSSHKPLSKRALSAIDEALGQVPESPLRAALLRLARRR